MTNHRQSILILSGVRGDTRRYRTFHLYEQSKLAGLDSLLSHVTDGDLQEKAKRSSITILHRAFFTPMIGWIEQEIHNKGGKLIQDIDDLLFEPNAFRFINSVDFADPIRAALYQEEMHLYRQTLDLCDVAITSTGYLAERIQRLGKPVHVHRNGFSLEMLDLSDKAYQSRKGNHERIVIGYASGTATHNQDFALIKPALISTMQKFAHTELMLVGPIDPGKDWGSMADRVHRIKKVPWRELPAVLSQFDINLAPVQNDNPFGQSKSEIKYVEAALVRVPTIASPSDAYQVAIKPNINGFLAESTKEWEANLEHLICEPTYRCEIGEIAIQDVLERYHPQIRAREFVNTLNTIIGYKIMVPESRNIDGPNEIESIHVYWSSAQDEKSPSLYQMALYTLRQRGLNVLVKQILIYIRRWLAPVIPYRKSS
jgi:glycosyltransferase involved in cell wall biosynthesis